MKIPSSFHMLGHRYNVIVVPKAQWKDPDCVGLFYSHPKEIHLLEDAPQLMEHALLHELTHAALMAMGRTKLYADEAFVDMLSGLFHQALTTAEWKR